MNTRVIPAIGINLARRCKTVLLAQLYYAVRGLLFCCGVLFAFLGFFGAEGVFESLTLDFLSTPVSASIFAGFYLFAIL